MKSEFRVAVSGGFDPIHEGHIDYLEGAWEIAQEYDGYVLVILMREDQLEEKGKGHPFYGNYDTRERILKSIKYVDEVVPQVDHTIMCDESLEYYHPDVFAKGGDRTIDNIPEHELRKCDELGIKIMTGVGGYHKVNSSSWLIHKNNNT